MIKPISVSESSEKRFSMNFESFVDNKNFVISNEDVTSDQKKKPRRTKTTSDGKEIIIPDGELTTAQSKEPYLDTYSETNNLLRGTIGQIDAISIDVKSDLDQIRSSKVLKNKYVYIPTMASTIAALINTKVTAIREINKSIHDSHDLELKRMKDLKLDSLNVDDDKKIMDMYNAFIQTPTGPGVLGPSMTDMTLLNGSGLMRSNIGYADFSGYTNSLTPTQNMMRYENNPDVETVVIYDPATQNMFFDVINIRTMESIPNVSRPDQMFIGDLIIDERNGIARNSNLDQSYKVITVNSNPSMSKY